MNVFELIKLQAVRSLLMLEDRNPLKSYAGNCKKSLNRDGRDVTDATRAKISKQKITKETKILLCPSLKTFVTFVAFCFNLLRLLLFDLLRAKSFGRYRF